MLRVFFIAFDLNVVADKIFFSFSLYSTSRRPRKSPEASGDSNSENFKRSYEERNRESERYRGSERERETRNRH